MRSGTSGAGSFELSVIIAARNAHEVLPAMLDSLAAQTWTGAWEVIVADNGSSDDTPVVARRYASALPNLRVVDAPQITGQAYARNMGVGAATGRSLLFLDADDELEPTFLAAMSTALSHHVFVAARLDSRKLNLEWVRSSRPPVQTDGVGGAFGWLPGAAGCSLGVRRDLFVGAGGFDVELPPVEDIDLCWRLQRSGVHLEFVPEAVIHYRYRTRFRDIYRQARGYGRAVPLLYRRYRDRGMPRRHGMRIVRFWLGPLRRIVTIRSKGDWAAIVFLVGFRAGLLAGCWRARVLYV